MFPVGIQRTGAIAEHAQTMIARDLAFAAALRELFGGYTLPPTVYPDRISARSSVLRQAERGKFRTMDFFPHGMVAVPPDEVTAVWALVYG